MSIRITSNVDIFDEEDDDEQKAVILEVQPEPEVFAKTPEDEKVQTD